MEKKKPEDRGVKVALDEWENPGGSDALERRIEMVIRQLPQADPPSQLLPFVMGAVRAKEGSVWSRVRRWATSPMTFTFTPLRMGFAAAFSALVVFGVFGAFFAHDGANRQSVALQESRELVPVMFTLDKPEAHSVQVVGSFNNWVPQPCELHQLNGSNVWTLSLRLQPGRYQYSFLVDGRHMPHPRGELSQNDGFGNQNTVLALSVSDPAFPKVVKVDQTGVSDAVEDAKKAGVSDETVNEFMHRAGEKGVENLSMAKLVRLIGEVKKEDLPPDPFINKIEEGLAKSVPPASIEQVLYQKQQDYRYIRSVMAEYLKKHGLQEEIKPEDLIGIAESLYCGLSREDLVRLMAQAPKVDLFTLKNAIHVMAALRQIGFDPQLSDKITASGLQFNFFAQQHYGFARSIAAAKNRGISEVQIALAAMSIMKSGGTVADFCSQVGISLSEIGQYGL